MGKPTGFLEYNRQSNKSIEPKERIKNYKEFHTFISEEERIKQGARCMNCGVPFCQSAIELKGMVTGCPLHNLIPEWNDTVYQNTPLHGISRLLKTNNFPEFTGRVCPALCEKACICGMDGREPVTVRENELFLIENAYKKGEIKPKEIGIRSDKKIAVIGSGPSGLAVADQLNFRGHNVTVFERDDRLGGLLMYGIPNMKIEKNIIDRRIEIMKEEGITFVTNTNVGVDISYADLDKNYDAIVLCCGAKKGRVLNTDKADSEGVFMAVDFLTSTTKSLLNSNFSDKKYISAKDKNVIIVGGGDTGNDCVATAIRHGCKSVTQLEITPEPPKERQDSNPWPEWPKTLKTDYGQEEAIYKFGTDPRVYSTTIKEIITKDKKVSAVKVVCVEFVEGKIQEISGSERELPADMILIAMGFVGCEDYIFSSFNVEKTQKNTIASVGKTIYNTNMEKIFSCGDVRRGQSLVVWAIKEGRECARVVDEYLMGYTYMT